MRTEEDQKLPAQVGVFCFAEVVIPTTMGRTWVWVNIEVAYLGTELLSSNYRVPAST